MTRSADWLLAFRDDVYSQTGEDGVIEKALEILPETDGWCAELGAWNGELFSNTCHLIESRGYRAVLIEGDGEKFAELERRHPGPRVVALHCTVGWGRSDGLDAVLGQTAIPEDFDFLSLDVDGNDYHLWAAMTRYRPKLLCVEFNPTIPTEVEFVQPRHPRLQQGASLRSLVELGRSKGYELISVLPSNAILVRAEHFPLFEIADNRPRILRQDLSRITHLFHGYDGTVFLRGYRKLHWHGLELDEPRVQRIPRFFRRYPGTYGRVRMALFRWYRRLSGAAETRGHTRKLIDGR